MVNLIGPGAFGALRPAAERPANLPANGAADPDDWFKNCSSPVAADGTVLDAHWFNALLALIRQFCRANDVTENNLDDMLMARAMRSQRMNWLVAGGTANAITLAPAPAFAAAGDVVGVPLRFIVGAANTGAAALQVNALPALALVWNDGTALRAGDLLPGAVVTAVSAGGSFRITDMVSSAPREARPGFSTVINLQNAPPASPVFGDAYAVDAAPTGAWSGQAGRIALWVGAWRFTLPPAGHIVSNMSQALDAPFRFMRHTGTGWGAWIALTDSVGPVELATLFEGRQGTRGDVAMTPRAVRGARFISTRQAYTASGAFSFTVPADIFAVRIRAWGGGGGGGFGASGAPLHGAASGGGGGGFVELLNFECQPGDVITGTVGAGGAAGTSGAAAGSGADTVINLPGGSTLTAGGGAGGTSAAANAVANRVAGGTAAGGDTNIVGESSEPGRFGGNNLMYAGRGGNAPFGGFGGLALTGPANPGIAPGGGGGGSGSGSAAGAGANGSVIIEY
ncbi:hypothetical protein [Microcystis phage vB_MweS-yong2]|nr:hypothetical protein [Microcystis phage vB_MweS-yong2]